MKRICLFAGYSGSGRVEDYVIYYIKSMSELSDVYYMADCVMNNDQLDKLQDYVKGAFAFRHGKYDFGSWQELINKIGYDKMAKYDELILCNDSCFGPFYPLKPIFDIASADTECDFWGMTEGRLFFLHLQSYFLVFKNPIFMSVSFKSLFESVRSCPKEDVIKMYESVLTKNLCDDGFKPKKLALSASSPYDNWQTLLKEGVPFFKVLTFTEKENIGKRESLLNWEKVISGLSDYDVTMIKGCLTARGVDLGDFKSFRYRVSVLCRSIMQFRKWLIRIQLNKKRKVIRFFGIYLIDTEAVGIRRLNE